MKKRSIISKIPAQVFEKIYALLYCELTLYHKRKKFDELLVGHTPCFINKKNRAVVIVILGSDAHEDALETAFKFTQTDHHVIFGNKGLMRIMNGRVPDTLIIDCKTFFHAIAEFKTLHIEIIPKQCYIQPVKIKSRLTK